jgi:coenzyme F420 hydrogenase subunit beta
VGICPTSVLALDKDGYPVVENLSSCTDCELCVKVCPGDSFDALGTAKKLFDAAPDPRDIHGVFLEASLAHASDANLREDSSSGGVITALLLSLLEHGEIDGAVVVVSDEKEKWKGKAIVARNREQLLLSTKSKYAIVPTNSVLGELQSTPGRYALVGLPCQIHGYHKAIELDRRLKDRIVLTIGLFCHAAVEHDPMRAIWNRIENKDQVVRFISRVGKHPGAPHVEYSDGTLRPVYFPEKTSWRPNSMEILNILYRLYTPPRCFTCYDATAEFAELADGDPWMAPPADHIDFREGYSFCLIRTNRGKEAFRQAMTSGNLKVFPLERQIARTSNTMMGEEKRWRAFRIIETLRRQGRAIPSYGFELPPLRGKHFVLTEINIFTHIFSFIRKGRGTILAFTFSPLGWLLLRLNHERRCFRNWRRDTLAKYKRRRAGG